MMLALEDLLLLAAVGLGLFFFGRLCWRTYKSMAAKKRNPVEEAKLRLRVAEQEAEAAKINAQADKIVDGLYEDVINETGTGPRVVSDDEAVQALDEQMDKIEKGKRHHG